MSIGGTPPACRGPAMHQTQSVTCTSTRHSHAPVLQHIYAQPGMQISPIQRVPLDQGKKRRTGGKHGVGLALSRRIPALLLCQQPLCRRAVALALGVLFEGVANSDGPALEALALRKDAHWYC